MENNCMVKVHRVIELIDLPSNVTCLNELMAYQKTLTYQS